MQVSEVPETDAPGPSLSKCIISSKDYQEIHSDQKDIELDTVGPSQRDTLRPAELLPNKPCCLRETDTSHPLGGDVRQLIELYAS